MNTSVDEDARSRPVSMQDFMPREAQRHSRDSRGRPRVSFSSEPSRKAPSSECSIEPSEARQPPSSSGSVIAASYSSILDLSGEEREMILEFRRLRRDEISRVLGISVESHAVLADALTDARHTIYQLVMERESLEAELRRFRKMKEEMHEALVGHSANDAHERI